MHQAGIRLLEFVTLFHIGGTERQVVNLAQGLDRSRFELSFACLERSGPFLKDIESLQIPLTEYKISSLHSYNALRKQFKLAMDIRRSGVQIVHSYNFYSNVFAIPAARLARGPVIVASIRDAGVYLTPMKSRVQKFICGLADCILVNAEAIKQWLIAEGYHRDKITVIGNGVDLSIFRQDRTDGKLHHELGLPPRSPLVVVISRLNKLKGIEYFLDATAILAARFPQVRFLVMGDGGIPTERSYKKELEEYAARLGLGNRVIFTGFRADIPEVLAEASVSVLPSLSEGLSNTLLESMAAGVPVVATKVGGNPEVVKDGVTGLLVQPRDSAALARAISLLLEQPQMAASLGQAGRQRVAERFSKEQMVRETEGLYLRLVSRPSRHLGCATKPAEIHAEPSV